MVSKGSTKTRQSQTPQVEGLQIVDSAQVQVAEELRLVWAKVQYAASQLLTEQNPKLHDLALIALSILEMGFNDPPKFDPNLNEGRGGLIYGNGRTQATAYLERLFRDGQPLRVGDREIEVTVPAGVGVEEDSGDWVIPIKIGVDAASESKALRYLVDHNAIGMLVGDFTPMDIARTFDAANYTQVLSRISSLLEEEGDADFLEGGMITNTVSGDDLSALMGAVGNDGWDFAQSDAQSDYEGGRDGLGDGAGSAGEGEDDLPQGSLLQVLDVCIHEPRTQVHSGQIWTLDGHWLIIGDVLTDWPTWAPYLSRSMNPERPTVFCPYPGPFVALSRRADQFTLLLVQPNPYIAGHIIDRFVDVHGEECVDLIEPREGEEAGD